MRGNEDSRTGRWTIYMDGDRSAWMLDLCAFEKGKMGGRVGGIQCRWRSRADLSSGYSVAVLPDWGLDSGVL